MSTDKSDLNLGQANLGQQNLADRIVMPERESGARRGGRFILFAGVAGACVLGVGAGLWARPAMNERRMAAQVPKAEEPAPAPAARQLRIVVDARPPSLGAPIEVLPKGEAPPVREAAPEAAPDAAPETARPMPVLLPPSEPQAPRRAPDGLMRILAPAFALAAETLVQPHTAARSVPEARPEPALRSPAAPKPRIAKARPLQTEAIRLAKAEAQAEHKATLRAQAQAQSQAQSQAKAEHRAELARAEAAKASAHKIEIAKAAKAERQEQVRLAKAEARGRALAREEAREDTRREQLAQAQQAKKTQLHLANLMRTLAHALPHKTRPEPPPILTARLDHRHGHKALGAHKAEPRVEQASLKSRKGHAAPRLTEASHPVRPHAAPAAPPAHATGLMRVSTRCASRDPGEAIVCADPNLGAADRQLTRAYQGARAAGVPDSRLRQQQQHWLSARSTAAREAPWAVRDVYLARIAELNGQAREAHGDGY